MFGIESAVKSLAEYLEVHRWMVCQTAFMFYMIALSFKDIKERRMSLLSILAGVPLAVMGFFCGREIPPVMFAAGAAVGAVFVAVSKVTDEAFGYGDSLVIIIMGLMLGFWKILYVLLTAFILAAVFSVILLFRNHFNRKAAFPFVPFLTAAYIGGMLIGRY